MSDSDDVQRSRERSLRRGLAWLLASMMLTAALVGGGACGTETKEVVVHRANCEVCHAPRNEAGEVMGIEHAHPIANLNCTDCHGGNAWICDGDLDDSSFPPSCDGEWVYDKEQAHVSPGDGPKFIKNLSSRELDELDPDYVQFINPGDFRVADRACGNDACHPGMTETLLKSTMTHTSGELTVARYRAGMQPTELGVVGALSVIDETFDASDECASDRLEMFAPDVAEFFAEDYETGRDVAVAQEQYMVKSCLRCHLNDFGENRFQADFRSSGCTACHMVYADDGLSQSADPRINKQTVPHPKTHELVKSPPTEQCTHCHYRGGRIGMSYQGYRESGGPGKNPENIEVLGIAQHGHDAAFYITDENSTNDFDETPADVHFEAGMHCVDCHTVGEVHGNGHIYADTQCAVSTECEDCHGSVREHAVLTDDRPNLYMRDGNYYLRTKVTNQELLVKQTKDTVDDRHEHYSPLAEIGMAVNAAGFSHTDEVECYTCHAAWTPSCYGCHVEMDFTRSKRYQTTGDIFPGHPTGSRSWVVMNDLVLMRNTDGKLAPSMPAERFFMTVTGTGGTDDEGRPLPTPTRNKPRSFTLEDGRTIAAFGQRAFNPHTTRRRSQFMACDRCHSVGDAENPENATLLDVTHGFGSERFPFEACDIQNDDHSCNENDTTTYQLDAIQTRQGEPLVVVGHSHPSESRPLTLDEIEAMRSIVLPEAVPYSTEIPDDAATDPEWPRAQRME